MGNGIDPTWEVLLELLDDIDHSELAKQVKTALHSSYSLPFTLAPCTSLQSLYSAIIGSDFDSFD